jgi:hypothetical protein
VFLAHKNPGPSYDTVRFGMWDTDVSYQYIAFIFGVGTDTARCLYSTEIHYSWILTSLGGRLDRPYPALLDLPSVLSDVYPITRLLW